MIYVARQAWGAKPAKSRETFKKPERIYVHHTASNEGTATTTDDQVRMIQADHLRKWADVGYSFLLDAYGNVFEGRGWGVVGAHTYGWNSKAHGFAYLGNGDNELTKAAQEALQWLILESDHRYGELPIFGHRDAKDDKGNNNTHCPGNWLYKHMREMRKPIAKFEVRVPEVKITESRFENVNLKSMKFADVMLGEDGNGWKGTPIENHKIVAITPGGAYPPADGYWPLPSFGHQDRNLHPEHKSVIEIVGGANKQVISFTVWYIE